MNKDQVTAIAVMLFSAYGPGAFSEALRRAQDLSANRELCTAAVWNEIAEEVSVLETSAALKKTLGRSGR